jgi:hypothetical protein
MLEFFTWVIGFCTQEGIWLFVQLIVKPEDNPYRGVLLCNLISGLKLLLALTLNVDGGELGTPFTCTLTECESLEVDKPTLIPVNTPWLAEKAGNCTVAGEVCVSPNKMLELELSVEVRLAIACTAVPGRFKLKSAGTGKEAKPAMPRAIAWATGWRRKRLGMSAISLSKLAMMGWVCLGVSGIYIPHS